MCFLFFKFVNCFTKQNYILNPSAALVPLKLKGHFVLELQLSFNIFNVFTNLIKRSHRIIKNLEVFETQYSNS